MPQKDERVGIRDIVNSGRLRPLGGQILAVAAVLLIASILMLGVNFSKLHSGYLESVRTNEAVMKIAGIESKLVGVEMTVRGYALTGDPSFLKYQERERKSLAALMAELSGMIAAEPSQTERFAQARALIRQRLDLYAYLSRPAHVGEVAKAITDRATRKVMARARASLSALRVAEVQLLQLRQDDLLRDGKRSFYLAAGIVVLAFLVGALGLVLARSGGRKA